MKLNEAISRIDALKPNTYSHIEKIMWVSALDGIIKKEIIDTHEGGDGVCFNGYDENTDLSTELLVPPPYDEIYLRWLEAKIDYSNGEYNKYNNSVLAYNDAYVAFDRYYNRTHMPKGTKFKYF